MMDSPGASGTLQTVNGETSLSAALPTRSITPAETTPVWSRETRAIDPEDGWGWAPESKVSSGFSGGEPEAEDDVVYELEDEFDGDNWVDEELDEYPPEFEGTGTVPVRVALKEQNQQVYLLGAFLLCFVILGGFALKFKSDSKTTAPVVSEQDLKAEALDSARVWEKSANESVVYGKHDLAADQFAKALEFLKKGEAEPSQIQRVRVGLAKALGESKDFIGAHKQWSIVAKTDSSAEAELPALEKKIREQALALNSEAKELLENGDSREAKNKAKLAHEYLTEYGGQADQKATSLHLIALSHKAEHQNAAATQYLKRAQGLSPTPERAALIKSLASKPLATQSRKKRVASKPGRVKKRKLSLGGGSSVPKGTRTTKATQRKNQPDELMKVSADTSSAQNQDYASSKKEQKKERLGGRDVLDSYKRNDNRTTIPGLR